MYNTDASPPITPLCGSQTLSLQPFYDVAKYLSTNANMIVLVYDKRGRCNSNLYSSHCSQCTLNSNGQFSSTCYHACSSGDTPQLYNLNILTLDDYARDAYAGLKFLASRSDVNTTRLNILGHSEGVNVVIKAGSMWNSNNTQTSLSNIFLMNGMVGFSWGTLVLDQLQRGISRMTALKSAFSSDSATVNSLNSQIQQTQTIINGVKPFFLKFVNGDYPLNVSYNIGIGTLSGYFLNSSFYYSSMEFANQYLVTSPSYVCSLNSPSDLNIQPDEYKPLLTIVSSLSRSNVKTISGLTLQFRCQPT